MLQHWLVTDVAWECDSGDHGDQTLSNLFALKMQWSCKTAHLNVFGAPHETLPYGWTHEEVDLVIMSSPCSCFWMRQEVSAFADKTYYSSVVFDQLVTTYPHATVVLIMRAADRIQIRGNLERIVQGKLAAVPGGWRPRQCNTDEIRELWQGNDLQCVVRLGDGGCGVEHVMDFVSLRRNTLDLYEFVLSAWGEKTLWCGEWDCSLSKTVAEFVLVSSRANRLVARTKQNNPQREARVEERRMWRTGAAGAYTVQEYLAHVQQKRPQLDYQYQILHAANMWYQSIPGTNPAPSRALRHEP